MSFPLAFIDGIGGPELMLIMFIILVLFGADKMPGLAKGLGKSLREFKKAANGIEQEVRRAMEEPEEPLPTKFPAYPPSPKGAIQQAAAEKPAPPPAAPDPSAENPPASPPSAT